MAEHMLSIQINKVSKAVVLGTRVQNLVDAPSVRYLADQSCGWEDEVRLVVLVRVIFGA